jgi:hypothetical protein
MNGKLAVGGGIILVAGRWNLSAAVNNWWLPGYGERNPTDSGILGWS